MNYEILINKYNKVHKEIIKKIKLVEYEKKDQTSSLLVEEKTLEMFLKLKNYIYETKKIIMDLKMWYISPEELQQLYEEDKEKNGKDHADKYISFSYTSEHNVGLAINYIVMKDGRFVEDITEYEYLEECKFINNNAHKFGFIIRYPKDKEKITEASMSLGI